jgi:hypothetical protein
MHGVGMFDVGLEIGTAGIGSDDIQSVTNIIINGLISTRDFTSVGVRLTSVGALLGSRNDSSKLISEAPLTGVPEPSTLVMLLVGCGLFTFSKLKS